MFRCENGKSPINHKLPAILLIHGFGGNRSEVRPLADHLRGSGYEVVSVQLPGHREDRRALEGAEAKSKIWQEYVIGRLEELRHRSDRVAVIGFSMGGLLATQAVTRALEQSAENRSGGVENENVDASGLAMVTINTPVYYWNYAQMLRNIREGGWNVVKGYADHADGKSALGMWEFQKLLWRTKPRFRNITCPLLVIQSANDDTVWPSSAIHILRESGGRGRMIMFPEGGHQILTSGMSSEVCEEVEEFLREWISDGKSGCETSSKGE